MKSKKNSKEYWEDRLPWAWKSKTVEDYREMRRRRYELQDYMKVVFPWHIWKGKRVLEVGCGTGIDSIEFEDNGAIVNAVDFTDKAVDHAQHLKQLLGKQFKISKASATSLPFEDSSFDLVYSYGVLHHIPDVNKAVSEIHRVLKPTGKVWAMLYHRDSLLYIYSIIFLRGIQQGLLEESSEEEIFARFSEYKEYCPYSKAYTIDEAYALFNIFINVTVEPYYNVYDTTNERKIKVHNLPKRLGFHLIVKGEKAP